MKKQWRLRYFLLAILIAFNAVFLSLITISLYSVVHVTVTEQTRATRLHALDANQRQISNLLRQIEETGLAVSTNPKLREVLSGAPMTAEIYSHVFSLREIDYWLTGYTAVKPEVRSIKVYSIKSIPSISELILPASSIPWGEEAAKLLGEFDSIWMPVRNEGKLVSEPVLTYVMKIFNQRGELTGYVEINLKEKVLQSLLQTGKENAVSNEVFLLLDPKNRLMSTVFSPESGDMERHKNWLKGIGYENDDQISIVDIDKESYMYIYSSEGTGSWRLVNIIESQEVYKYANKLRNIVLLTGLFALLLTVPVAFYLSKRIIRPVSMLLQGFEKVKSGNFNERMDQNFIIEFHELLQSYNLMVRRLQMLLEQLEEEHRAKRDAEVNMLQSQINPHFLYNTLDTMNWMAAVQGAMDVSRMAANLARLFRISMGKGGPFIRLKEEMEHAATYVLIQQERFNDKFSYSVKIDTEYSLYYVPRIILQPFIENAIIHGFEDLEEGHARIVIKAEPLEEQSFRLIIEDNGSGLSNESMSTIGTGIAYGSGGYGITNVNQRIQLFFGSNYGVSLQNLEKGGVRVQIILPVIRSLAEIEIWERTNRLTVNGGDGRHESYYCGG
ncbi:cache domain-containing sensor histidine kinase [Paenibacillus piri]|uniref:Sensor histidine kinase n=1 Tax=Paenibacillus piri TaxID=2547395 RepID=A0A4R5KUW0_9BACL|nr:sensor histidine kinase [Paenibacillus piri]TDF99516.1 sensor histidine kinase [Paenibacillus piri]